MMSFKGNRLSGSQVLWHLARVQIQAVSQKDTDKILSGNWLCCFYFDDKDLILHYFDKSEMWFTPASIFPLNLE